MRISKESASVADIIISAIGSSGVDFSSSDYEISIRAELAKEYLIDSLCKVEEESREITVREPLPFVQENKNRRCLCMISFDLVTFLFLRERLSRETNFQVVD